MVKFFREKRDLLLTLLCSASILACILLSESHSKATLCKELNLIIKNKATILSASIIENKELENLYLRKPLPEIKSIEVLQAIKANPYVYKAFFYKTLLGKVYLEVVLREPIAKIVFLDKSVLYIDIAGGILPPSKYFNFRVLLIETQAAILQKQKNLSNTSYGASLLALVRHIHGNQFLHSQITHMKIKSDTTINLYTNINGHCIEFGKPEDIAEKFDKLVVYYRDIVPSKGIGRYKRINLEFKGQIVCE